MPAPPRERHDALGPAAEGITAIRFGDRWLRQGGLKYRWSPLCIVGIGCEA